MGLVELEDAPRLPEPGRELGTGQRFTRSGGKSLGHHSERRRIAPISNEKVLRKVVRAGLRCVSGKPNAVFASRAPGFPF